jgi:DNA invertase Pin-like site-specific DNA recombinase
MMESNCKFTYEGAVMKKAYGYLRVSGQSQIGGDGFRRQKETILKYTDKHKIDLAEFFEEEGVSGTRGEIDRPAFQAMVSEILKNGVSVVIVEGLDRLAREYRIQETLIVYLASKNIELISARTDENITEAVMADPLRKALVQIQGVFSELEKNLLVKKLKDAREAMRAKTGKCEGRKSYSEAMPEVLKEIKRLRRARKGMPRRTYDKVAAELNAAGFKSMMGKPFTGSSIQLILRREKARKR